ncbi:hypothetical protein GCM10010266_20400 [Streptomyces griseomycini]|nr:hypothetical protein GCM10010266_20400 [Streptomyces griseomycini]
MGGEHVQDLEVAGAHAVRVQGTVEFALDPRVQREHAPPPFHERLFDRDRRHGRTVAGPSVTCRGRTSPA